MGDIDKNGTLDIVLMHYDIGNPVNEYRMKIGWNLDSNADASSWTTLPTVAGLGNEAKGSNIALGDLDGNGTLDMILIHEDRPGQFTYSTMKYKIGQNLSTSGVAGNWITPSQFETPVVTWTLSPDNFGAGIGLVQLPGSSQFKCVQMAFLAYSESTEYAFWMWRTTKDYMGVGGPTSGNTNAWSDQSIFSGPGRIADGTGIAFGDIDRNGVPDMVMMNYDDPAGANTFRYKIAFNVSVVSDNLQSSYWH